MGKLFKFDTKDTPEDVSDTLLNEWKTAIQAITSEIRKVVKNVAKSARFDTLHDELSKKDHKIKDSDIYLKIQISSTHTGLLGKTTQKH